VATVFKKKTGQQHGNCSFYVFTHGAEDPFCVTSENKNDKFKMEDFI
jgi:hypothetical protein